MLTIPFVIDNQQHKMAEVLNDFLRHHNGHSLDIATAYFNDLGNFRLLLGDEPEAGSLLVSLVSMDALLVFHAKALRGNSCGSN